MEWVSDLLGGGEEADAGIDAQSNEKTASGNAKGNGNSNGDYTNNGGADNDRGGNGPTHFIPAYDLMFYVNDINRENAEVLTLGSRYLSDTSYEYGNQRLYADHEGESETYLYDGRGSVVQLLQGGTVSQSYSYNAYGYINADEYGIQAPFYGYNGEEQNPFTGLQYLRARYYAPQNGSFITQDSFTGVLTNALSQNRYTYVENDPLNAIDPTGHAKRGNTGTKGGSTGKSYAESSRLAQSAKAPNTSGGKLQQSKPAYIAPADVPKPAPNYQKPTYTSGAAKAAQSARLESTVATSTTAVSSVATNPYMSLTKAAGQTKLAPTPILKNIATATQLIRNTCSPSANHLLDQHGWNASNAFLLSSGSITIDPSYYDSLKELAPLFPYVIVLILFIEMAKDREFEHDIVEKHGATENSDFVQKWKDVLGEQSTPANPPPNGNKRPDDRWPDFSEIKFDSHQVGKKFGEHMRDYPNMKDYTEYIELANQIFNSPEKIVLDAINGEYYYIQGTNLLRLTLNGEFISLYHGATSTIVLKAIANGGLLWPLF